MCYVNNNLSKYATKSALFAPNSIIDPNTCTVPFAIVNGWDPAITNVPNAAKKKFSVLLNIWAYGASDTGNLTSGRMQILIVEHGGGTFTRWCDSESFNGWA